MIHIPLLKPSISSFNGTTALLTGLLAAWNFDEISGNIVDITGNGINLTPNALTYSQLGKLTDCCEWDGSTSYAYLNSATNYLTPASNHSIACWVYRVGDSPADAEGVIMSKYWSVTGYRCYRFLLIDSTDGTNPNRFYASYYDSSDAMTYLQYDPPSDIWIGNWKHVVYTRSGSNLTLYVDGEPVATGSGGNGSMRQQTNTVRDHVGSVHRSSTTRDNFLYAKMNQLAVWDIALTSDQVLGLFNNGNGLAFESWT
jgi:hypothetical protein